MPNTQFRHLIVVFCVFVLFAGSAAAQSSYQSLYTLYEQKQYEALKSALGKYSNGSSASLDIRFFYAVFEQDAELAKQEYQYIFDHARGKLKNLAAEKLREYYYARGYYVNAEKYHKFIVDSKPADNHAVSGEEPGAGQSGATPAYFIQVGAFGMKDNARELSQMLATQDLPSRIVERTVNGKTLFCVWIEGKKSFEGTLKYADKIKSKYDLEYRIIKP